MHNNRKENDPPVEALCSACGNTLNHSAELVREVADKRSQHAICFPRPLQYPGNPGESRLEAEVSAAGRMAALSSKIEDGP